MNSESNINFDCPTGDIAAYIDGELDERLETRLETHLISCRTCSVELNQQKQFLRSLDFSLKNEREIVLPDNFAKLIVANAESTVSGLRRPRERFNAVFISAALFLFALFAMGTDAGSIFAGVSTALNQLMAVVGFFASTAYSFIYGIAIVVRSFAAHFRVDIVVPTAAMAIFFTIFIAYASRKLLRIGRV